MDPREFPTKGNLMLAKNSLMLARQGYDLMDKKRNILLKELMGLIDEAKDIQECACCALRLWSRIGKGSRRSEAKTTPPSRMRSPARRADR